MRSELILVKNQQTDKIEAQIIQGYAFEVGGFEFIVDKRHDHDWYATEVSTGLHVVNRSTKKECIEWVRNNIERVQNAFKMFPEKQEKFRKIKAQAMCEYKKSIMEGNEND